MVKTRWLVINAGLAITLLSGTAGATMSDDNAVDLVRAMAYSERSYQEAVLTLIADGRTLPQATAITMRAITTFEDRSEIARTVMCMSKDVREAELVTNAAISAVAPGDAIVNQFVNEFVKYQRSTCLDTEVPEIAPAQLSFGAAVPGPEDVSQSR